MNQAITSEEKNNEYYDIERNTDACLIGESISIATCDMAPSREDVQLWLEALVRRKDQDNEHIKNAIYDCKFYLGYFD